MDDLLTTRQLQALLHVDRITIYRMLGDGRLAGFKVGGQWRFARAAVEQWLHEQQAKQCALPSPAEPVASLSSPEMLPLTCVQTIQDLFAGSLDVGAITTTLDGVPLTRASGRSRLCELALATASGRERCLAAWQADRDDRRRSTGPAIGVCQAGLQCACSQVEVRGTVVALFVVGPFLDAPWGAEAGAWAVGKAEMAAGSGLDPDLVQESLDQVPVLDPEKRRLILDLMPRMAAALSEIGEERAKLLDRLRRIAEITHI